MATEVIQKLAPPNPHITRAPVSCYRPPLSQPYVCPFQPVMFTSLTSIPIVLSALLQMSHQHCQLEFHHQSKRLRMSELHNPNGIDSKRVSMPPAFKQLPLRAPAVMIGELSPEGQKNEDCCWTAAGFLTMSVNTCLANVLLNICLIN